MRHNKRERARREMGENKEKWKKLKPEYNHWVCTGAGSDRYGHQIIWVSDDDKELKTEDGLHLILNDWYIWINFKNKKQIMPDNGYYLWGDTNPEYRDPSF